MNDDAIFLKYRVDCIAGKPPPTVRVGCATALRPQKIVRPQHAMLSERSAALCRHRRKLERAAAASLVAVFTGRGAEEVAVSA